MPFYIRHKYDDDALSTFEGLKAKFSSWQLIIEDEFWFEFEWHRVSPTQ